MLAKLVAVHKSWEECEDLVYRLATEELPPGCSHVDTCFAMYCSTNWAFNSSLVIFNTGEAGLECRIGRSLWYLLEEDGLLLTHQLGRTIKYKYAGEQDQWIEYE